jgi:hypothetical protein
MPTSTDLVTDLPADFEVFGQAVDTSLADLKGGTTGQVLKKNSNTDMDFVWSADSAGMTNPMTTTGDTIYSSSGSTPARLGIGSTGQILTVTGGVPTWATPAAGGGMTLLSTTTMSGASTTISSISADYTNLLIVVKNYQYGTGGASIQIGFNGSGDAANYFVNSYGTTSFAGAVAGYPNGYIRPTYDRPHATAQDFSFAMVVNRYSSSDTFKMFNYSSTFYNTVEDGRRATIGGGGFASTSAISSFNVTNNQSYSATSGTIYVYGVK